LEAPDLLPAKALNDNAHVYVSSTDTDTFTELVREHRSVLLAQAVRLTAGDRAWAEDVVQETFIRAWRHIDRMTPEHGSVRGWLVRVAHNLVMDGYRARRARPIEVNEAELYLEPTSDASDQLLSALVVEDALSTLNESQRVVIEHTYLRDQTLATAALELDLPLGTVKSRVYYALRQMRGTLAPVV
jgi:RNA polymerase sigma-70 factor, ECF subfamily